MDIIKYAVVLAVTALLLLAGCATSPETEGRRQAIEADIEAILAEPLDPEMFGGPKHCLSDHEYRDFRALDERHIVFEGRRDKMWINTLRTRCSDLRFGHILVVKSFSAMRLCDADTFQVTDWFEWPWYRRWPWYWDSNWGTGMQCSLGKFQPVTPDQVAEIEAVLRSP